jgi:hypothetical protein
MNSRKKPKSASQTSWRIKPGKSLVARRKTSRRKGGLRPKRNCETPTNLPRECHNSRGIRGLALDCCSGISLAPMRKRQLPVSRAHDPLAQSALLLLNLLRWLAILGTLIFGNVTTWFFINQQFGVSLGFLIVTIVFGIVWRGATQRLKLQARTDSQ